MTKYYAVAKGLCPGIYTSWEDAKQHIIGIKGAKYKSFTTEQEAREFLQGVDDTPKSAQKCKDFPLGKLVSVEEPSESENTLIVFTDGSAIANGKRNAIASYATVWPFHPELDHSARVPQGELQTNNRGEYRALIHAFIQADEIDPSRSKTLIVYTDSMLLINSLTLWMHGWKRNGWRKSDGSAVANVDLLHELDMYMAHRKVSLKHVKAHTGKQNWEARYNDKVDRLARSVTSSIK